MCKSGVTRLRKIWLTRHGESEYNRKALLGGDSNITEAGQKYAAALPDIVIDRVPLVLFRLPPYLAPLAQPIIMCSRDVYESQLSVWANLQELQYCRGQAPACHDAASCCGRLPSPASFPTATVAHPDSFTPDRKRFWSHVYRYCGS